jgi:hypothetical protein
MQRVRIRSTLALALLVATTDPYAAGQQPARARQSEKEVQHGSEAAHPNGTAATALASVRRR